MGFTSDVTLNDGTENHVYSTISLSGTETLRRDSALGLVYPKTMRISHQAVKAQGSGKANRCVVRLDSTKSTSMTDPAIKATESAYFVFQKPESLPDQATMQKLIKELISFLTSANVTKLLNGES